MADSTYGKADRQADYVADRLGGETTPRSGGTIHKKGDVHVPYGVIECKTYMKERSSFTVKREWLDKLNKERSQERKVFSAVVINFGGNPSQDNHVVMRLDEFNEIYKGYLQTKEE